MQTLRPWQEKAINKALAWLVTERRDRHFLINAAPGSGKTIAACVIARELISRSEIDRVIVIAPRREVVNQWASDFRIVNNSRFMAKVTGADSSVASLDVDYCATWAAIQGLEGHFQKLCASQRCLVICDEHHHAAVEAAWGASADSAFREARFVLVLTGTPIRSDGEKAVWLAYDDRGAIEHPEEGTFTLTYGDAVDFGYCRPVAFHRHEGRFNVDLQDGVTIKVSGQQPATLPPSIKIPGLQRTLNFYKLACTPKFEKDHKTPSLQSYQASMIESASQKLVELRDRMPNAGGLVIAPSIEMAQYFSSLIERMEGEKPILVHSQLTDADGAISAFRNTTTKWLVSVAMISEGVDIPRLRVLIYLSNALTELAFRQAIGRVVRTAGPEDDTRAYVVMPSFDILEQYARRVEEEMPHSARTETPTKTKRCPACSSECPLNARKCENCGHEFPERTLRLKSCPKCSAQNPASATSCQHCGASFATQFELTLTDALRMGVIVRGIDIDEDETREAEKLAPFLRQELLKSGDARLIKLFGKLPEESWVRVKKILNDTK